MKHNSPFVIKEDRLKLLAVGALPLFGAFMLGLNYYSFLNSGMFFFLIVFVLVCVFSFFVIPYIRRRVMLILDKEGIDPVISPRIPWSSVREVFLDHSRYRTEDLVFVKIHFEAGNEVVLVLSNMEPPFYEVRKAFDRLAAKHVIVSQEKAENLL